MDQQELKKMALDAAVGRIYQSLGIAPTKVLNSYIRAGLTVDMMGDSPVVRASDPASGRAYETLDAFAEVLKVDPDFRPRAVASHSEPAKPRHVSSDDLASGRQLVDLKDIAEGRVIVDVPEAHPQVELKDGEVSIRDGRALSRNLEDIASGKVRVV